MDEYKVLHHSDISFLSCYSLYSAQVGDVHIANQLQLGLSQECECEKLANFDREYQLVWNECIRTYDLLRI